MFGSTHGTLHRLLLAFVAFAAAAALAACGGDDEDDGNGGAAAPATQTETAPPETAEEEPAAETEEEKKPGALLKAGDSQFGTVLLDKRGQALYLFDKEKSDESECYDDCATEWPPMITQGEPEAGDGIDADKLGTTERRDGTLQVTYNGHPLYYYEDDSPGVILCHNVPGFGGLWLVVDPKGDAVGS